MSEESDPISASAVPHPAGDLTVSQRRVLMTEMADVAADCLRVAESESGGWVGRVLGAAALAGMGYVWWFQRSPAEDSSPKRG